MNEKHDISDVSRLSDAEQERRYYAVFGKNLSVYPNKLALAADTERKCPYISAQDISVWLDFCRFLTPSVSLRLSSVLSLHRAVTIPFILPSVSAPPNGRLAENYDQVIKLDVQTAFLGKATFHIFVSPQKCSLKEVKHDNLVKRCAACKS